MDVRRTQPALVDDAYRRVLDALARTTTEKELFAELCAVAVERDGIEHATVATPGTGVVVARGRQVSGQTFSRRPGGRRRAVRDADAAPGGRLHARGDRVGAGAGRRRRADPGHPPDDHQPLPAGAGGLRAGAVHDGPRAALHVAGGAVACVNPETVIGRTDAELMPLGGADELTELKRRVIEHGEHVAQEIAVDDRCFWVSARPVRDAAGEIVGLAGQSINVTARKYAERELDRIASAADHGADAVISFDKEGRVQRWNRSAERLFGYTADEAHGRTMLELGPAADDRQCPTGGARARRAPLDHFRSHPSSSRRDADRRARDDGPVGGRRRARRRHGDRGRRVRADAGRARA